MPIIRFEFFECDNPECGLRFPGYDGYPKNHRCPICRSSIHNVAYVISSPEAHVGTQSTQGWKVEALLDNIRSTWNVGSMFRTSDGTGVKKVYLCGITPTPENPKVGKTALGAELNIAWERLNNGVQLASKLKAKGYHLWALEDLPQAEPLYDISTVPADAPTLLIVGNEVCGVDPGIIQLCDKVISIPMIGMKQSYNVAVAFGMAMSFLFYRHSLSQGSFRILPKT